MKTKKLDEEEYLNKIEKILEIEICFGIAYRKLTDAFSVMNTTAPKKVIRNYLVNAILAIYSIGDKLDINIQDGIDLMLKDFEEKGKEQKDD